MPPDPHWQGAYYYGSYECSSPAYYSRAVFVSEAYFASPRISAYVVTPSQNAVAARTTVNVTSYSRVGAGILNRSIDVAKLQAAIGVTIRPVRVVHANGPIATGVASASLQELKIYRPLVASIGRPSLQSARPPLKLDQPSGTFDPPRSSPDTGALPPLDRPNVGDNAPSLGGVSGPALSNPIGGSIGGLRGRLGR
jgi:hypothetical protein